MAESPFQPERHAPTPADKFDAWLREADARETARPRRSANPRSTGPQRAAALALGLALWGIIFAGLSRWLPGWP